MKGNRKIFQVQVKSKGLDGSESLEKVTTTYINRNSETFGMYRATDGLEWAKVLKHHLLFLLIMNEYSDPRTGIISLTPSKRLEICSFFEWENKNSLSNVLKTVIDAGGMTRCNGSNYDFMVNPMCFYKGSTKDFKERYDKYRDFLL